LESSQLKIILTCLKEKQKRIRIQQSEELMKRAGSLSILKTNKSNTKYLHIEQMSEISKTSFSPEVIRAFENIFAKYDSLIKVNYEQKVEEVTVNLFLFN
jgi:hypothetical protein